ncbi:class I SAM-dependent methyltransferase [Synechococcus sp. CS-1328]|uniref:class I SAM-dependent methyltransferase n=1 Tax=Synechococcus sp. CS-1328 TaxID=2847976 RepID=UPI00223B381D|nr:class I SAM-dependent methyltransferase [Synechococcus sp. CS-1328]MCT0225743.1 class I SAM-dependent methyltransferase [Synechococcus sp. CS-1328]
MASISLDLGCGSNPQNPFNADLLFGVDSMRTASSDGKLVEVRKADLAVEAIPFAEAMFDHVTAYDFIEHVPRLIYLPGGARCCFVELMSEIYRVLKPGGTFYSLTPAYPSPKAFQDPTHVNIITESTFPDYFCGATPWARAYGFSGLFSLESQEWVDASHLSCTMCKRI